jgi:hypothetical protein
MNLSGLGPLHLKAVNDAGFDLVEPMYDGWLRAARSGTTLTVAVRPSPDEVLLAVPSAVPPQAWGHMPSDVKPPAFFAAVARLRDARSLNHALLRVIALFTNTPAVLGARVEATLATLGPTERTAEVRKRIGQDVYREALMALWGGRCAVTGIALPALLRASHAKPWKEATDEERLDMHNGLLLAVHLDALFDQGLLWFEDDGRGALADEVDAYTLKALGLESPHELSLRWVSPLHAPYLEWHRKVLARRN